MNKLRKPIKTTVKKSGKDLVSVAEKELGYTEGKNNNTKYGKFTGQNFVAWCQSFVSWVANKAGLSTSQSPKTASTDTGMAFFKNKGKFGVKGKYTPKRNDTVYFKSGGRSHVGIVKAVKNGKIYTIEGNSGDKVKARSYSLNDATITGYGKTSKYFKAKNKKKTVEKPLTKKEISEIEQLITNAIKTKTALKKSMIVKKYGQERAKQIQDAIGSFDNLQQAKIKVEELKKQVRELNKEFLQIDVDNYNKILDKYNAKLEITTSLTRQKNIEKNKLDIIKKSYDKQIEIAKIEKDSVKVAELRYQKEKEIYEIKQAILQHTLDDNESKRSLNNTKRDGSSTAKVKAGYYDADVKSYDSDIKAYKDSVKDYNKRVNAKGKDIKNAKNLKKLTKADKKKVQECIKNGKVIPNNIIKKVEKISPTLKNKMDDYNVTVELAKLMTQEAELGIAEAMNDKSEVKASKYDTYADEAQAVADAYSAQSFTQYSAKDKEALNKNIQKQMDKAYRNQIKAAKERGDYVLVTKLQAEWNKDKLDRKLESMQNYIDEKQAEMDLNDTYVEGAKSAWEKGVYLSRNKKIIQEQAEIEVEMLKKQGKYVEAQKVLVNAKQRQLEIERQIHSLIADAYDTLSGTHNTKADISTNIGDRLSNNIASMLYAQKSYDEKIKAESVPLKVEQLEVEKVKALNEAWMTAIGSIEQYFDRLKSDIETEQTHIQSMISLLETHGSFVNADMYTSLAEKETEKRKMALTEIKELQEYISKLPVGSDEWYDAQEKIKSLTKTAEESAIQFEEFSHKAIEAANAIKEFGRNAIQNLSSEADFYKSILAYSDLVDEDAGFFTKEGMATLALSADKISNNAAMVQKLNEAIEENEKLYVQGKIGFKEYTENYEKLNSERQNTILNVYAEKDAIKQLIEEAYNKQLQSLDDLIAKYKKALQAEKSLHDYQKNIEKQTKNLVTLKKRLIALQGDTSEEAKAKIQKLQVEIADAQDELDETEYSKYIEDQETMLDAMKEEYENFIKDQMGNATALVEKLIKELPMSAEEVTKVLQDIADENNTALSTALKTATQNGQYSAITKEVNSQGSQIATELGNLAEFLASQDTLYSRTLDELTNVYNNENIIATSLPNISTILGEIKELIATKETQIIINAEEQASQNDIPENPSSQTVITPTPSETKPSTSTQTTIPEKPTIIPITAEMYPKPEKPISTNPLNPNGSIVSNVNKPVTEREAMLAETRAYIKLNAYDAPRKKSEYSAPNQYIYDKTGGKILGKEQLAELAKKLGVTPGDSTDDTWKNKMLKKLKQVGYSQGGVVGALQRIPGENGDEGWATLKRGEAILTPKQTEMFKQFTSYLPEFNNPTKFDNIAKNYDVSKFVQKPKLDIGGINVTVDGSNITDAETFAKELPRAMINAIQKDKQCRMAFQDIGVGQLMGSNKSYMRYK